MGCGISSRGSSARLPGPRRAAGAVLGPRTPSCVRSRSDCRARDASVLPNVFLNKADPSLWDILYKKVGYSASFHAATQSQKLKESVRCDRQRWESMGTDPPSAPRAGGRLVCGQGWCRRGQHHTHRRGPRVSTSGTWVPWRDDLCDAIAPGKTRGASLEAEPRDPKLCRHTGSRPDSAKGQADRGRPAHHRDPTVSSGVPAPAGLPLSC